MCSRLEDIPPATNPLEESCIDFPLFRREKSGHDKLIKFSWNRTRPTSEIPEGGGHFDLRAVISQRISLEQHLEEEKFTVFRFVYVVSDICWLSNSILSYGKNTKCWTLKRKKTCVTLSWIFFFINGLNKARANSRSVPPLYMMNAFTLSVLQSCKININYISEKGINYQIIKHRCSERSKRSL